MAIISGINNLKFYLASNKKVSPSVASHTSAFTNSMEQFFLLLLSLSILKYNQNAENSCTVQVCDARNVDSCNNRRVKKISIIQTI